MQITNKIAGYIAGSRLLWPLFHPFAKFFSGVLYNRKIYNDRQYTEEIKTVFKDLKVMNGPFKGMAYPDYNSFGSQIFPKLLGSYESELNGVWKEVLGKTYERIIDVGSAEGYFSVGLALKSASDCKVIAVDISSKALKMAESIARLNNVHDRLEYRLGIDDKGLEELCRDKKCFILCDSEGFEKELFTDRNISALAQSDVLIETHDSRVFGVSKYLDQLFSKTHDIQKIFSVDDIQKFNTYKFAELDTLSDKARLMALSEGRSNIQEWLYCKAR